MYELLLCLINILEAQSKNVWLKVTGVARMRTTEQHLFDG